MVSCFKQNKLPIFEQVIYKPHSNGKQITTERTSLTNLYASCLHNQSAILGFPASLQTCGGTTPDRNCSFCQQWKIVPGISTCIFRGY